MTRLFIHIYEYFRLHRGLFYIFLAASVVVMGWFAVQVRFEENVIRFLPDTEDAANASEVFDNLKVKDKIVVMLGAKDTSRLPDADVFTGAAARMEERLNSNPGLGLIEDIFYRANENTVASMTEFVYDNLPLFLKEEDYLRFDSLLNETSVSSVMQRNYNHLLSPAGATMKEYIMRDPLSLGSNVLKHLEDFKVESNYELVDGYIFSADKSTLLMFITPVFSTGRTGDNDALISSLEEALADINSTSPELNAVYFGGPSVGVYNARQIKRDTVVTGIVALIIIIIFISLVFKRKSAIPLIIVPALFGSLFALCFIFFFKGTISAIAVGAGSIVMGIALSYSIHMLAHQNHVSSVQQLIREIARPLTIGSFTTIGAFAGLLFTTSDLLRDFGLYASLVLIGTTVFCLIFLPHFLKGQAHIKKGKVLRLIEKANAYPFERNKWLIGTLVVITVICLFTSQHVGFNENMMSLNYEPQHIKDAERKLTGIFDGESRNVLFVSVGSTTDEANRQYAETNRKLTELKANGDILDYASVERFFIPYQKQQERLKRWKDYWTAERISRAESLIDSEAGKFRFRDGAFDGFFEWLAQPFTLLDYSEDTGKEADRLLSEWHVSADSLTMLITQVRLKESNKETVYDAFRTVDDLVIFDRAYFTNKWVSAVKDDFNLILYISSFLVFFALWLSYGRIELTLISFLPMMISWVIIIGLMGLLGIEFNIVNIILSTFIFGIGDDFSIFIMDGLQSKYRTGQKLLDSHKTAISFSAFTMIVGMGALVFARHPALQSISLISIVGMVTVMLVSFTIQPVLFNLLIARPAAKGLPPYTLVGLLRSTFFYLVFIIGCILLLLLIVVLAVVPISKKKKKLFVCYAMHYSCRALLAAAPFVKKEMINPGAEDFKKPAVIIANHQSFVDIIMLISFTPRIVMITKKWVWDAPVLGTIIRYVDFYHAGDGYELSVEKLRQKVANGYSIVIFPEGTRTLTGKIKRFHKGAFYLAQEMNLDILPIVFYGNNRIIPKAQPFHINKGQIATRILPRVQPDNTDYGSSYQERCKNIAVWMRQEYAGLCQVNDNAGNPYFYERLIQNYIYKGPVEEWYMRIKVHMEKNYRVFDKLIPRQGQITDIGCGFGALCYMLGMLSRERRLLGIDYDPDKVALAEHAWLRKDVQSCFICADALKYNLPPSNVFIMNDMLHYMDYEKQYTLLTRCASLLLPGGMVIVRDGNASERRKHRITRITELFSTRITGFNIATEKLCFTSGEQMQTIARDCGMQLETIQNDKYTSNTIYIFKKADDNTHA